MALAFLPPCAEGGPKKPFLGQKWPNMAGLLMSQCGLRGSKMIQNDQYNIFLTIWGHFGPAIIARFQNLKWSKMIQNDQYNIFFTIWDYFGPIWTLLDLFRQTWFFASKTEKCFLAKVIWSKKLSFVWKDPKESKWAQNGPKWSKICQQKKVVAAVSVLKGCSHQGFEERVRRGRYGGGGGEGGGQRLPGWEHSSMGGGR